jgi:CBS domain-containing protein
MEPRSAITAILVWLGYINTSLAVFNMIPAFPLDGGRVLRSIVWAVTKDENRSTHIAARVGQIVAFFFILLGIWRYFSGAGFGGLWIAFVGWFLMDAARASSVRSQAKPAMASGVRVSDVVSRGCVAVNEEMSLQEFVDVYLLKTAQRCFAVKGHGGLVGLITRHDVGMISRETWGTKTVGDAMRPLQELHIVAPDTQVMDALKLTTGAGADPLPVVENGRLQGVVFRSQLQQAIESASEMKSPKVLQPLLYGTTKVARSNA